MQPHSLTVVGQMHYYQTALPEAFVPVSAAATPLPLHTPPLCSSDQHWPTWPIPQPPVSMSYLCIYSNHINAPRMSTCGSATKTPTPFGRRASAPPLHRPHPQPHHAKGVDVRGCAEGGLPHGLRRLQATAHKAHSKLHHHCCLLFQRSPLSVAENGCGPDNTTPALAVLAAGTESSTEDWWLSHA